jgi:hypothetical protein
MPQVRICKIRRTEKSDVKEVYNTKQTQSQAGPETPHRCLKSAWESASEAWPLQLTEIRRPRRWTWRKEPQCKRANVTGLILVPPQLLHNTT